ncbi:hypothetical protein HDU88_001589 [Geranomyces variabilis]|nr:hypothetical protein HDU88_001589 [Geranomyces variabilis]
MIYMNKGGGWASRLFHVLEPLMKIFRTMKTTWETQHVPGAENVLADLDLRQRMDRSEWQFSPASFPRSGRITLRLNFTTDRVELELFAMGANHFQHIPKCCTLDPRDFEAHATDRFSIPWTYRRYAKPPLESHSQVVAKIHSDMTLLVVLLTIRSLAGHLSGAIRDPHRSAAQDPHGRVAAFSSGARLSAALFQLLAQLRKPSTRRTYDLNWTTWTAPTVERGWKGKMWNPALLWLLQNARDPETAEVAPEPPRARIDGASGADGDTALKFYAYRSKADFKELFVVGDVRPIRIPRLVEEPSLDTGIVYRRLHERLLPCAP